MIDKERIKKAVTEILYAIGEDPNRDGLLETPDRVARMYEEIFAGVHKNPEEDIKIFSNVLGVKIEQSSINNGIPYVSSGILANNHNIVVGSLTTGPEIMMLTRAFLN